MSKVAQDVLKAFGATVQRARGLEGWKLQELANKMAGTSGVSFLSDIEKGKRSISLATAGKLIKALELDESWIDKFTDSDITVGDELTKTDQDADLIIARAQRENVTEGASEALLIKLANTYAEGTYKDRETAYIAVRTALEAASRIHKRGEMPPDNTGSQLNAIMAEVAKLNNEGALDDADALLDQEDRRMRETHKSERDRQEQQATALLTQRLDQDRLRNRPDLAAKRLINNLRLTPQAGKLFWAIDAAADEWKNRGDATSDIFALHTALELAKANYKRTKNKSGLAAQALNTLGWCNLRLAERSSNDRHIIVARNAFEAALKKTSKSKAPRSWSNYQDGFGVTLAMIGEREGDIDLLQSSVKCLRAAVEIGIKKKFNNWEHRWNALGISLQKLGEATRDPALLGEGVTVLTTALLQEDRGADKLDWATAQGNLAHAQRWLGDVTDDLAMLTCAHQGYAVCDALKYRDEAPFIWAILQWNIADLALARHRLAPDPALLTEARTRVTDARAFFVDGSDHQTQRCDDLLAQINQAEA
ncbi:MAG: helix-turn-helix transcriptional regulator [Rhodobacteraceae bacterium]|nr:helix-turn-helix transcriptional regulator [Paracoccaceae bacterium]